MLLLRRIHHNGLIGVVDLLVVPVKDALDRPDFDLLQLSGDVVYQKPAVPCHGLMALHRSFVGQVWSVSLELAFEDLIEQLVGMHWVHKE